MRAETSVEVGEKNVADVPGAAGSARSSSSLAILHMLASCYQMEAVAVTPSSGGLIG